MRTGKWIRLGLAVLMSGAGVSTLAQENPNPEQMKKMYDEAVAQLKASQERKNQLAAENEKLTQQLNGVKGELSAANAQLEQLKRSDADSAEKTFFLRSHYVAWQQFVRSSPELEAKWRAYLGNDYLMGPREPLELVDRRWPIANPPATQPASTQHAATQPTTMPPAATQPVTTQPSAPPATTNTVPASSAPTTQPAAPATQPTTQPATRPSGS